MASLSYPAVCTTADGLTRTVKNAEEAQSLGLANKTWEKRRGAFFEAGLPPYKDGKTPVSAQAEAKKEPEVKAAPARPTITESVAPPPPPPEERSSSSSRRTKKKASRRSSSDD